MFTYPKRAFTLIELLATITIMAVLIVAALPYVADYSQWARSTSQKTTAETVSEAIARWIAVGGSTTGWTVADPDEVWTSGGKPAKIINDLQLGWTIEPAGTPQSPRQPFLASNTPFTVIGAHVKIGFNSKTSYTVTGRSE